MAIKVLMVGGRRCGKTTALASMFDDIINGPVNNFFTITDNTVYKKGVTNTINGMVEDQDTLEAKTYELKNRLDTPSTETFVVDSGPTYCVWKYTLRLNIPGSSRKYTEIEFQDCPGEFFQAGLHDDDMRQMVRNSDVYVVVVDTPYLMEAGSTVGEAVNCISSIHNYLAHIDNDEGRKAKMVVFVPIKCEKWAKEGRIMDVVNKIKSSYDVLIRALNAYARMNICILPIQTAGNIVFSELRDAYTLSTETDSKIKCCKLNDRMVRTLDGKIMKKKPEYTLNPDIESQIASNLNIFRPYAWYYIDQDAEEPYYAPYNCEQLPLHIVEFMAKKMAQEGHGTLYSLIFGGISRTEMEQKMRQIQDAHLIKENLDGIVYIKKDI